ncbi:MAG: hypothetical protein C4321_00315, partial [Chloroflexota bacterium]
ELAWKAADGNFQVLAEMFPLIRGMRGEVGLTKDEFQLWTKSLQQAKDAQAGLGTTQTVLNRKLQGTAAQFRIALREVQRAVILFGRDAAPAVLSFAKRIGMLAEGFSKLSEPTRKTIANFATWAAGFLIMTSVVARVVVQFNRLRAALVALRAGWTSILGVLSPVNLGIAAIAATTLIAIDRHLKHKEALRELKRAYDEVADSAAQLRLQGEKSRADALEQATKRTDDAVKAVNDYVKSLKDERDEILQLIGVEGDLSRQHALQDRFNQLQKQIDAIGSLSTQDLAQIQQELLNVFTNPDVDPDKLLRFIDQLNLAYRSGSISASQYKESILGLSQRVDEFAKDNKDAADEVNKLGTSMRDVTSFFQSADDELSAFDDDVRSLIKNAKGAANSMKDMSDPAKAVSRFLGGASTNAFNLALRLSKLGIIKLSPARQEAVQLAASLARVEDRIHRLDDAIKNNQDDMSMWEGRIKFIDDVLGDHQDTLTEYWNKLQNGEITVEEYNNAIKSGDAHRAFSELNKLVEEGALTQEEANKIKEDAIWIIQRSEGGIRDERVEMARQIPILRKYIEEHDRAHGAYQGLTDEQQGFLAALQSENVQMVLNTAVTLKFLEALGAIPEGVTARFLADVSKADPIIAAFLQDIGLIDGEHNITFNVSEASKVQAQLASVRDVITSIDNENTIRIDIQTDDMIEARKRLAEFIRLNGDVLANTSVGVAVTINGVTWDANDPNNPIKPMLDALRDVKNEGGTTNIDIAVDEDNAKKIEETKKGLEELDNMKARPKIQISGSPGKKIDNVKRNLDDIDNKEVTPKITIDKTSVSEPLKEIDTTVENLARQEGWVVRLSIAKVEGSVDPAALEQTLTALMNQSFLIRIMIKSDTESLSTLSKTLADFITTAYTYGVDTANQYAAGIINGTRGAAVAVQRSTVGLASSAMYAVQRPAYDAGLAGGRAFDYGIAQGIYSNTTVVTQAAAYVAQQVFMATMRALQARSPSKKGMVAGKSFVDGILQSMISGQSMISSAARQLAQAATDTFTKHGLLDGLALGSPALPAGEMTRLAAAQPPVMAVSGGAPVTSFSIGPITVNGGATNEETAEVIWRRLEAGLTRWAMAHGAGG